MSAGRHIAPHRIADALAGRLGARQGEKVSHHLADCARCASVEARLVNTRAAMDRIARVDSPDLGWDKIGVRLYWETSSARHAALRRQVRPWWRRRAPLAAAGLLAVGATAVALVLAGAGDRRWAGGSAPVSAPVHPPSVPAAPGAALPAAVPAGLRAVVTFARGEVLVDGAAAGMERLFDKPIGAGTRLGTGDGRVVVQFGAGSGFALEPRSHVLLRRFDARGIELEIDGVVEIDLARRAPDQSFEVIAGRHRVSVRGTGFRVQHRGGELDVSCAHGRVVVSDGEAEVALEAGQRLQVLEQLVLARARRAQIDLDRLAELRDSLAAPLLPAWTEPRALFETSSLLDVAAPPGRPVRVDGIEVGEGSFALRVMSGRHQVQVADRAGEWGAGAWIHAAGAARQVARAGADGSVETGRDPDAAATAAAEAAAQGRRAARRARHAQLAAVVEGSPRARQCVAPLEKRDLVAGSYVVFDIGINPDGSQGHLNVRDSNVPGEVERCLRRVIDAADLPPGPAATVRYKLAFD